MKGSITHVKRYILRSQRDTFPRTFLRKVARTKHTQMSKKVSHDRSSGTMTQKEIRLSLTERFSAYTFIELQDIAEKVGLQKSGKKAELVSRLVMFYSLDFLSKKEINDLGKKLDVKPDPITNKVDKLLLCRHYVRDDLIGAEIIKTITLKETKTSKESREDQTLSKVLEKAESLKKKNAELKKKCERYEEVERELTSTNKGLLDKLHTLEDEKAELDRHLKESQLDLAKIEKAIEECVIDRLEHSSASELRELAKTSYIRFDEEEGIDGKIRVFDNVSLMKEFVKQSVKSDPSPKVTSSRPQSDAIDLINMLDGPPPEILGGTDLDEKDFLSQSLLPLTPLPLPLS